MEICVINVVNVWEVYRCGQHCTHKLHSNARLNKSTLCKNIGEFERIWGSRGCHYILLEVKPCSVVEVYRCFCWRYFSEFQGRIVGERRNQQAANRKHGWWLLFFLVLLLDPKDVSHSYPRNVDRASPDYALSQKLVLFSKELIWSVLQTICTGSLFT